MTTPTSLPPVVGVLGGGRMGAGIAHAFLLHGAEVLIVERDADAGEAARARVEKSTRATQQRGRLTGAVEDALARLRIGLDPAEFAGCQLVIEAVPEDRELKVSALAEVEQHLGPDAVLASNTSSLSVTYLATALQRPESFLGLHFFNPVPASDLIEVVVGRDTADALVETATAWTEALGKTAVVVQDAPGFASSRLGVAIALEAIRMVEEGVASAEDIDNAMVLGYRHPTGPLRTTDIVGLDVRLGIAEHLAATLGPRFEPPQLLRDKVARGELGRKSGKGFFTWE